MNLEQARFNMIEQQIRPWDVLDPGVLSLLGAVRREDFVPPALRGLAFMDTELPLPGGQCMLAPRVEARLLQALQLHGHEQVMEIGAGSGFMAALLAHQARQVISLEIRPALASMARANLQRAGVRNAQVVEADAAKASAGETPFDAIVLSGSVARVSEALQARLTVGGRLVAIEGQDPVMRAVRITRVSPQRFERVELFDTVAPRLDGFEEPPRFSF
jgi:protein-L-isoaspartate(D-aspartate) O-methyltransferase